MNKLYLENQMQRLEKTAANLKKRGFDTYVVQTPDEARALAMRLAPEGESVAAGGSESLAECGLIDVLNSGRYNFIDRFAGETPEEREELTRRAFFCDTYFCSANAVTEDGIVYNVDGKSNRVAAIAFGPKSVIMVVGRNKITRDLDEAAARVKRIAAPINCARLGCQTPCAQTGECVSIKAHGTQMTDGCAGDARICCDYLVLSNQRDKNRIKVILVNEELGF
ncbi:MAG: lactate utilization protein [Oscillospiraceae bacterium]